MFHDEQVILDSVAFEQCTNSIVFKLFEIVYVSNVGKSRDAFNFIHTFRVAHAKTKPIPKLKVGVFFANK